MEVDYTYSEVKVLGFDADDTLWVNETYFREAEEAFAEMLLEFETKNKIDQELYKREIENLKIYGYGVKAFTLSMIECALELSNYTISNKYLEKIIDIGRDMLNKPVELLDDVEDVLKTLLGKYKLILVTKGDLLDQERKLEKSRLSSYFDFVEILSDKKEANYKKLLSHLNVKPNEFLMIGNSLKSDVLPLVNIGAKAIHVPFHTTWIHEQPSDEETKGKIFKKVNKLKEIIPLLCQ